MGVFRMFAAGVWAAAAMAAPGMAQEAISLELPAGFASGAPESRDYARLLQIVSKKPGGSGVAGDDSCQYANDFECDEPGVGTGACSPGTDYSDCWRVMAGVEDDSCQWANDGECDEPFFGTGACTQATDATDCGPVAHLRFQTDQCATAFNGRCEDPDQVGAGSCEPRSDRADCFTRERPLTINDHFFGRDDRVLMDTGVFPWSIVGTVTFDAGGVCTATLVSENVLVTAAHCISEGARILPDGEFATGAGLPGGPRRARVVDFLIDEAWNEPRFSDTNDIDGTDWALLRLDRPLGAELGHAGVLDLDVAPARMRRSRLQQAGYSWDTGENLSGNLDCGIVEYFDDNTMAHDCDTTRGDSGSPFFVRNGDDWRVVATDSNFRPNPDGPMIYIAALSGRWARFVNDFQEGRIGNGGLRLAGPGKPGAPAPVKK